VELFTGPTSRGPHLISLVCCIKEHTVLQLVKNPLRVFMLTDTRGVQKVRSLIQLITEYEHDILSLFNTVLFNRNALSPVILQGPYSIVEKFLFLVLKPVTCGADNIIVASKFPSFQEFVQFWKQIKSLGAESGPNLANTVGGGAVQSLHFGRQSVLMMSSEQVHCPDETTLCVTTFLVSSLSVLLDIFQSNQCSRFL